MLIAIDWLRNEKLKEVIINQLQEEDCPKSCNRPTCHGCIYQHKRRKH